MKIKKSLRSRIRGWFPQEPKLLGKYVQNSPNKEKKRLLIGSVVLLSFLVLALAAFQVPKFIEGMYPHEAIRTDDSNLSIRGIINSIEENHKAQGMGSYHIFRYYMKVNISETTWAKEDLASWINASYPSPLDVSHIVEVGYDYPDISQIVVGQTIECKGFYLRVTDSPQSAILTIAPAIGESYLKPQIS
jgi:hypothetical protein